MKLLLIMLLFLIAGFCKGQVYEYWIYDKKKVDLSISDIKNYEDTNAYLIKDTVTIGKIILYYDKQKTIKFEERQLKKNERHIICWYKNGNIRTKFDFYNGELWDKNDLMESWYYNGQQRQDMKFKDDLQTVNYYYQSGAVREIYVSKRDESIAKYHVKRYNSIYKEQRCEDGFEKLKDSSNTKSIRTQVIYYCNRKKEKEFIYNGLSYFGNYYEWYENGQLRVQGQYDPVPKNNENKNSTESREQGKWIYYREDGSLIKTVEFKNGVQISK